MFEDRTFENIMSEMLETVDSSLDRREGSVIYTALVPAAREIAAVYASMNEVIDECFPDTASLDNLIRFASDRGVKYREAEKSLIAAEITLSDGSDDISAGERFFINSVFFVYAGTKSDDGTRYVLECEKAGEEGNISSGNLIYDGSAASVISAEIKGIIAYGRNADTIDELRERYFKAIEDAPFAGNRAAYRETAMGVSGIGGCRVTRQNEADYSFYIYLIDDDLKPVSNDELKDKVESAVTALETIGHTPTVKAALPARFEFSGKIISDKDYESDSIFENIKNALRDYVKTLAHDWGSGDTAVFRINDIIRLILSLEGVVGLGGINPADDTADAFTVYILEYDGKSTILKPNGNKTVVYEYSAAGGGAGSYEFTDNGVPFVNEDENSNEYSFGFAVETEK